MKAPPSEGLWENTPPLRQAPGAAPRRWPEAKPVEAIIGRPPRLIDWEPSWVDSGRLAAPEGHGCRTSLVIWLCGCYDMPSRVVIGKPKGSAAEALGSCFSGGLRLETCLTADLARPGPLRTCPRHFLAVADIGHRVILSTLFSCPLIASLLRI